MIIIFMIGIIPMKATAFMDSVIHILLFIMQKKKIYSEQKGSEYDSLPYVSFDLLEASSFQRGMDTYLCWQSVR